MTSPTGRETLQLVVDAITTDSERAFVRLSGAAETASRDARESGETVARAADRAAQARLKQADADDAVRLAEVRLQEVLDKGNATATQIATATTRLEQARRRQSVASRDAEAATEALTRAERDATEAIEQTGHAAERTGIDLRGLATRGAALAGGFELGSWAKEAVGSFLETARGAQQLSASMNATTEQGGQLARLFGSLGLESSDLLEIQAEFAQVVQQDAGALERLGAQTERNADGTTNWATTLRGTLAALQRIPDATERNRQGFRLFGEEGFKQLSQLINSSRSVDEAFDLIGTPVTDSDLEAVREFDNAMLDLNLASSDAGRTLGTAVVPVLTGLVEGLGDVAGVIDAIPGPLAAGVAASVLFGIAQRRAGTEGTLLAAVMTRVSAATALYTGAATRGAGASALLGAGMQAGRTAIGGLVGALGGPLGIALTGIGVGFTLVNALTADNRERAEAAAQANTDLAGALAQAGGQITATVREQAATSAAQAGILEAARRAGIASGDVTRAILSGGDALDEVRAKLEAYAEAHSRTVISGRVATQQYDEQGQAALDAAGSLGELAGTTSEAGTEQEQIAGELGGTASAAEQATAAVDALTQMIAAGTTGGREFGDAVRTAAEAQAEATAASDTAKAAIDAYNAVTRDAIETTLGLAEAQLGQRSSLRDVQEAMYGLHDVVEDTATPWSEVEAATDDALSAAIDYAGGAADAAVEAARAAGTVLDPLTEAKIRGQETIRALYETLQQPGITDAARKQVTDLIHDLQAAQEAGDVEAILKLTGAAETTSELDEATEDRTTEVRVETRNGPAVKAYLAELTDADRLALIRVETRNGPAVRDYIESLCRERLAIIRVETRGGPAVEAYLDRLSRDREVTLTPRGNGGASVGSGLRGAPSPTAFASSGVRLGGSVEVDLRLTGTLDRSQVARAERGRAAVEDIRAYEQRNGTGWRSR